MWATQGRPGHCPHGQSVRAPEAGRRPCNEQHASVPHVKPLYYTLHHIQSNRVSILHPASLQYTDFKIKYKRWKGRGAELYRCQWEEKEGVLFLLSARSTRPTVCCRRALSGMLQRTGWRSHYCYGDGVQATTLPSKLCCSALAGNKTRRLRLRSLTHL